MDLTSKQFLANVARSFVIVYLCTWIAKEVSDVRLPLTVVTLILITWRHE